MRKCGRPQWIAAEFQDPGVDEDCRDMTPLPLLWSAIRHVGGWGRFAIFVKHPRDASFARQEFLDYLRRHDPAYTAAAGDAIVESLPDTRGQPLHAKAARGGAR